VEAPDRVITQATITLRVGVEALVVQVEETLGAKVLVVEVVVHHLLALVVVEAKVVRVLLVVLVDSLVDRLLGHLVKVVLRVLLVGLVVLGKLFSPILHFLLDKYKKICYNITVELNKNRIIQIPVLGLPYSIGPNERKYTIV
jgi:hypothetical protein